MRQLCLGHCALLCFLVLVKQEETSQIFNKSSRKESRGGLSYLVCRRVDSGAIVWPHQHTGQLPRASR